MIREMIALMFSGAFLFVAALPNGPLEEGFHSHPVKETAKEVDNRSIIPLVQMKPGETCTLLLSTHCTVGPTRGSGLGLVAMEDGKPVNHQDQKTYERLGVTIKVPRSAEAVGFADQSRFKALKQAGIAPFQVTITAAEDAQAGLIEMHLNDSTCSGHCSSDFRILVVKP